jgi:hypothetical protein
VISLSFGIANHEFSNFLSNISNTDYQHRKSLNPPEMAAHSPHTFLTLLPATNIAYKPTVVEPVPSDTAVEGVDVFEAIPKTTRSSSTSTDDSTVSPRSSIDVSEVKNGGFLRLGF